MQSFYTTMKHKDMKKSVLVLFVLPFLVFLGSYSGGEFISYFSSIAQHHFDDLKGFYGGDLMSTHNSTLMDIASCGILKQQLII